MLYRKGVEQGAILLAGLLLVLIGLALTAAMGVTLYEIVPRIGTPGRDLPADAQPEFACIVGLLLGLGMVASGVLLVVGVFRGKRR